MKKFLLPIVLLFLLSIILVPIIIRADIVPAPTGANNTYSLCDLFTMLGNIYTFIVVDIAGPLAAVALIIGGICMLVSAGNPGIMGTGKKIIYAALIGLVLAFGSYAIINFILTDMLGYSGGFGQTLSCK